MAASRSDANTATTAPGTRVPDAASVERTGRRRRRRAAGAVAVFVLLTAAVVVGPALWVDAGSSGHRHTDPAQVPTTPVAIVFGAELAPGGVHPKPWLAARLDGAVELIRTGRSRVVLVSGDAGGASGNEIEAMTRYLVDHGVPVRAVVADPYGLDTYDTCARAISVYGVRRAVLVSQYVHIPRAVALCRGLGMDAEGLEVAAPDPSGRHLQRLAREYLANVKAAADAWRARPPAVTSPPNDAVTAALRSHPGRP
ncbi:MAG TPA: ElyC/SanA/YdcF family protein [Cryptosporangiaceae bacterium]|nr:ElyC/SanA/YdcF family protein [Cryptosporangiaceae bacterium]